MGYTRGFEDCTSLNKTKIEWMTDAVLLRQLLSEQSLESYPVLIMYEAHEPNLTTAILHGLLRDITGGMDCQIIMSSATVDAQKFADFFYGALSLRFQNDDTKLSF